jgi:hypothetical protein
MTAVSCSSRSRAARRRAGEPEPVLGEILSGLLSGFVHRERRLAISK